MFVFKILFHNNRNVSCSFPIVKEPFSPHGRGLVAIVYVVKRSFQFDMRQDTGRHMSCERAKVHMQSLAY